jgi:hypothetical protein
VRGEESDEAISAAIEFHKLIREAQWWLDAQKKR